ncbi:hypothetical protein ACQ858_02715 [Variovorax ureilyticus]|uniref:hypothetical protein n=1 Tax=Variovorax ureilyticus TaxID=1836198 RepID=UPI003D6788B9
MQRREGIKWLVAAAAVLAAASAGARPLSNYNAMRDTPITRFSKADVEVMTKTINKALDGEDGVTTKWENGASASGSVTPSKDPKGRPGCKLARVENRHGSLQNAGDYIFCRNKSSAKGAQPWQVVGPWSGD